VHHRPLGVVDQLLIDMVDSSDTLLETEFLIYGDCDKLFENRKRYPVDRPAVRPVRVLPTRTHPIPPAYPRHLAHLGFALRRLLMRLSQYNRHFPKYPQRPRCTLVVQAGDMATFRLHIRQMFIYDRGATVCNCINFHDTCALHNVFVLYSGAI
jgi:hypothetical protein